MKRVILSKDIISLLIHTYFDLETYYQCQFVCTGWRKQLNPEQLILARRHHSALCWACDHYVVMERKCHAFLKSLGYSKKQINLEKKYVFACPHCCDELMYLSPTVSTLTHHQCDKTYRICDCSISNSRFPHCLIDCPFELFYCDYYRYHGYASISIALVLLQCISSCEFVGTAMEVCYHRTHECHRTCLGCDKEFLITDNKLYRHLKICQPFIWKHVNVHHTRIMWEHICDLSRKTGRGNAKEINKLYKKQMKHNKKYLN